MAIQSAEEFAYEVFLAWRGKPDKEAVALVTARDAAIRAEAVERAVAILRQHQFFNVAELLAIESARASSTVETIVVSDEEFEKMRKELGARASSAAKRRQS